MSVKAKEDDCYSLRCHQACGWKIGSACAGIEFARKLCGRQTLCDISITSLFAFRWCHHVHLTVRNFCKIGKMGGKLWKWIFWSPSLHHSVTRCLLLY